MALRSSQARTRFSTRSVGSRATSSMITATVSGSTATIVKKSHWIA